MGAVLTHQMTKGLEDMVKGMPNPQIGAGMDLANSQLLLDPDLKASIPAEILNSILSVFTNGIGAVFLVALGCSLAAILASFFMRQERLQKSGDGSGEEVNPAMLAQEGNV
jgi:hypothetical protein